MLEKMDTLIIMHDSVASWVIHLLFFGFIMYNVCKPLFKNVKIIYINFTEKSESKSTPSSDDDNNKAG